MDSKLKPYDEYRVVNALWLNEIPSHWNCEKLGMRFRERRIKVSDKDFAPLSVTKNGIVPQLATAAKTNDGDNRKLVKIGDFVINSRSDRKGSSGLSIYDGSVSLINTVLKPVDLSPKYSHYLLKSYGFIEEFYRNGRGIVADLWTTRYCDMRNINIPLPPHNEQDQIVRYLDWKLSKINKFINAKKKQIELLKEQKKAIISEAVTKGLDPNAKVKPSGIDYIGDIPEEWKTIKLKFLSNKALMYGANESGIAFSDDLPRYIRITDISQDGILKNNNKQSLPTKIACDYLLQDGDILFARSGATVGKTFHYREEYGNCCFAGYLIKFSPNLNLVLPEFLYYFSLSGCYELWLNKVFIQATIQNVSAEKYKELIIPLPSINEQEAIVFNIKPKLKVIDRMIESILNEIELITEYRTTLVSNVVTGKVNVRNVTIENYPDEDIELEEIDESDDEITDAEELDIEEV